MAKNGTLAKIQELQPSFQTNNSDTAAMSFMPRIEPEIEERDCWFIG
jgi:hypothetical protein